MSPMVQAGLSMLQEQERTFFLRSHQNNTTLAMTSTATTGPAITPGFGPLDLSPAFLLQTIVGHCVHVLIHQLYCPLPPVMPFLLLIRCTTPPNSVPLQQGQRCKKDI